MLLVRLGLVQSRQKSQRLVLSGKVSVNGTIIDKCGVLVTSDADVKLLEDDRYVSRGGIKLQFALSHFKIILTGKTALDAGASTGGFTDCLLQHGIERVYSVDVGYGQLAWKLRNDPSVKVVERTNIRYLKTSDISDKIDIAVLDLSFISLKLVMPNIYNLLRDNGEIVALIKPQFEIGKGEIGKGGVVRDCEKHKKVIEDISASSENMGFVNSGVAESPIKGTKGNVEYFIYLKKM